MYKQTTKKIKDVWIFYPLKSPDILHVGRTSNDGVSRNLYKNDQIVRENFKGYIKLKNNTFFTLSTSPNEKIEVFDTNIGNFISMETKHQIRYINSNGNGLLYDVLEDWTTNNGFGNINQEEFEFIFERQPNAVSIYLENYYFLCFNGGGRRSVEGFSVDNCKILWIFSLNNLGDWYHNFDKKWEPGEIFHFVGVVDDVLWIDIQGHHLIGLDTETGTIKHDLTLPDKIIGFPSKEYHRSLPIFFSTFYDEENKLLFGLAYDVYIEVDLKGEKPFMTFHILEEECDRLQVHHAYRNQRCCFDMTHFYFVDVMTGKVAALNRNTKIFDWIYTFPEASTTGALTDIQVSDKNLYVLDAGGTLHIFDREETH